MFSHLPIVCRTVATAKSLCPALRFAIFDLTTCPFRVMCARVLAACKGYKVVGGIVRVIAVFVMNVEQIALRVAGNLTAMLKIRNLVGKEILAVNGAPFNSLPIFSSDCFDKERISMDGPAVIVHGAPTPTKCRGLAILYGAFSILVFPGSFSWHGCSLKDCSRIVNCNFHWRCA